MLRKIQRNNYISRILPVLFTFLIFAGTNIRSGDDDIYTRINRDMDIFGRVYKEIVLNYVDEVDPDKFIEAGIQGMLNTLDPYTNYLDVSRKDEVDLLTTGKYGGIGITIGTRDSIIIITNIMEGYSAQRQGLREGDRIIEIDDTKLTGTNIEEIRSLVRGAPGTQLKMKVLRLDEPVEVILTREEIKLKNVSYYTILEGGIGYIKLERFARNTENEIVDAINDIKSKGELNGFILDLRDNPGGLLDAAISVLNKFIDRGNLLVTTRGRQSDQEKKFFSNETPMVGKDVPLAVLINENTASASEIVAGAIQDLDRGIIIGTRSYGKGLVQVFTPLNFGSQLKITTQKYYTPSGRWIQLKNYFKENKAGVFKPNPFYNQIEFKTLNGRTVLAEGGISPDYDISMSEDNELLDMLYFNDMYFRFIDKYLYENPNETGADVTDNMINQFYEFIKNNMPDESSKAEKKVAELRALTQNNNYSDNINKYISSLEEELRAERLRDFERSRPHIKRHLEIQLLRKLNRSEKDVFAAGFNDDLQLEKAIELIKNRSEYKSLLRL